MASHLFPPLNALRRRERLIAGAWAAARWVAIVLAGLAVACTVDWWIDLRRDTPYPLRIGMLASQVVLAAAAGAVLLLPVVRRRSHEQLALFVEEKLPALGHRLISAVQFHHGGPKVAGMSSALIAETTREASRAVSELNFAKLADHRRLQSACWLALAIVAVVAIAGALWPRTLPALVARQLLADCPIPRQNQITNQTALVQPANEPVELRFRIDGPAPSSGELRIAPAGGSAERFTSEVTLDDGVWKLAHAAPTGDFDLEAWIGDARLREPGRVRLVPRPAVSDLSAVLMLPAWVGVRPDGSRYELPQARGEVAGIGGCAVRVTVKTQKPVVKASLDLLGLSEGGKAPAVKRTLAPVEGAGQSFVFQFDLREDEAAYCVRVVDEYGFENVDPPRREVRLVPEEPPTVALLIESFRPDGASGTAEDFEAEGVPVPLGGAVRIGYVCQHPYGLGRATLVYRVNEGDWRRFSLTETTPTEATGPLDLKRGCFQKSKPADQVQFSAVPSPDAARLPGRLEGGGRFDFQTRGLPGLKIGDTIEYFIEVSTRHPETPLAGRSETRAKKVVTVTELVEWIDATLRQEDRIRRLADRQRGVFEDKPAPKP
ncbi:MAG: hypothetical protein K1X57_03245 [Gemmataceae bacterium]|nr:hypothetical protein [Gemmataceae bacterium]